MTCEHCIGAEELFNEKTAKKDLRKFKKSGPRGSTKKLISLLNFVQEEENNLLDIGGGIGAIQWGFLSAGGSATTDIDASGAYLQTAEVYAREQGWIEKCEFIKGDFAELENGNKTYTYVTMDKVICCYPDFKKLLNQATTSCKNRIGITFPLDSPFSKFLSWLSSFYFYLKRNPYRTFIHPSIEIKETLENAGFSLVNAEKKFPWNIWVYKRD